MNEPDKYDEMATNLVGHCRYCDRLEDNYKCTYDLATERADVASALRKQGEEIERLQYELHVIGDMAVADWNDAVVGKVDAVVSGPPVTYGQARRAELAQYETMRAEIAELKAKLALPMNDRERTHWDGCWQSHGHHTCAIAHAKDAEKRGMERAASIADPWRDNGSRPWIGEQVADAIRAEIEKVKP